MKYYLITGKTPEIAGREEQSYIPEQRIQEPGGHIRIIPARPSSPEIAHVSSQDNRIEIGETNPFGKMQVTYHEDLNITNLEDWKRLLVLYGQRITHEYIVTPEGLKQEQNGPIVPAFHLISLLHDGFSKSEIKQVPGRGDVITYFKQKGRIEDETGQTYDAGQMITLMESK